MIQKNVLSLLTRSERSMWRLLMSLRQIPFIGDLLLLLGLCLYLPIAVLVLSQFSLKATYELLLQANTKNPVIYIDQNIAGLLTRLSLIGILKFRLNGRNTLMRALVKLLIVLATLQLRIFENFTSRLGKLVVRESLYLGIAVLTGFTGK